MKKNIDIGLDWESFLNNGEDTKVDSIDDKFDEVMVELTQFMDKNPDITKGLNDFLMVLDILDRMKQIELTDTMNRLYDALLEAYNKYSTFQCSCSEDGFDEALCIFEKFCQDNNIELVLPSNEQGN